MSKKKCLASLRIEQWAAFKLIYTDELFCLKLNEVWGRFPRVFGDKFGEEFCDKFGDEFSESPNLVMN